jgi:hypothetical protein
MPVTYQLIASNVLASTAGNVSFTAIPATYTDLILRASIRGTAGSVDSDVNITLNGSGALSYTYTKLLGSGSAASSTRSSGPDGVWNVNAINQASATASTFASFELYIPNYAGSANKVGSVYSVAETNATAVQMGANATLWSNTAAITQILLYPPASFAAGSSFYLYGIKNS